jgi:hypothetical protein
VPGTAGANSSSNTALHVARHAYAPLMIAAGVNAKAISSFLGHADIAITFDVYGHLMPGSEAEAAGRLEALLARSVGTERLGSQDPSDRSLSPPLPHRTGNPGVEPNHRQIPHLGLTTRGRGEHVLDFRPGMREKWVAPQGERPRSRIGRGATTKTGSYSLPQPGLRRVDALAVVGGALPASVSPTSPCHDAPDRRRSTWPAPT